MKAIFCLHPGNLFGIDGHLPGKVKGELQHFKDMTIHKTIIMGMSTFGSLGKKPLPHRKHIVVTKMGGESHPDVTYVKSIEELLKIAPKDAWVIGGANLLTQLEGHIDEYLISYPSETKITYQINGNNTFYDPDLSSRGFWPIFTEDNGVFNVIQWKRLTV